MSDPTNDIWRASRHSIAWCLPILFWEFVSTPAISHSNSWQGAWLSLTMIPVSAFFLCRFISASWIFVYGCGTSLLFVPRFLGMDRFGLWLNYEAPNDVVLVLWWVAIALSLGCACFTAASLRSALSVPEPPAEETPAWTSLRLIIAWAGCLVALLACITFLSRQRQFLEHLIQWPTVVFTVLRSVGTSTAFATLLLFLFGGVNVRRAFVTPGGFILLSVATLALYRLVATTALVVTTQPVTIMTVGDSYRAITTAGVICASLVLMLHIASRHRWRIPLIFIAISLVSSCFVSGSPNRIINGIYTGTVILAVVGLVVALWRDRQQPNRTDWLGVATHVWLTTVSFAPLLVFRS